MIKCLFVFVLTVSLTLMGEHSKPDQVKEVQPRRPLAEGGNQLNPGYQDLCGREAPVSANAVTPKALNNTEQQAYDLLKTKCATCHNPASTTGANSFSDILNFDQLVEKHIIKDLDSANSLLIERIEDGSMPQGQPNLRTDEIDLLKTWIKAGVKVNASKNSTQLPDVGFISQSDIEQCMLKDLQTVSKDDRPFVRYLTLETLYNSGKQEEVVRTRLAINKLLNSLSWKEKIKNPIVVDATQTLLRVDLRDYGWSDLMWNKITSKNPYPSLLKSDTSKALQDKTRTQNPFLRGDWVVAAVFEKKDIQKPEEYLYHTLLYDLPDQIQLGTRNALGRLEKILGVDTEKNLTEGKALRAGFAQSNVTKSNRVIERHVTPLGTYWKSFDFKSNDDPGKDILRSPNRFDEDGGEYIFSLPNKLHGYLVADKVGTRLDGAPTDVVVDPFRQEKDGVVMNGLSCMNCHQRGIKRTKDDMAPHLQLILEKAQEYDSHPNKTPEHASYFDTVSKFSKVALSTYKGEKALSEAYDFDEQEYKKAIELTENSVANPDPIFETVRQFENPMDLRSIAAELGRTEGEFVKELDRELPVRLALSLSPQNTTSRTKFQKNFKAVQDYLNVRKQKFEGKVNAPNEKGDVGIFNDNGSGGYYVKYLNNGHNDPPVVLREGEVYDSQRAYIRIEAPKGARILINDEVADLAGSTNIYKTRKLGDDLFRIVVNVAYTTADGNEKTSEILYHTAKGRSHLLKIEVGKNGELVTN